MFVWKYLCGLLFITTICEFILLIFEKNKSSIRNKMAAKITNLDDEDKINEILEKKYQNKIIGTVRNNKIELIEDIDKDLEKYKNQGMIWIPQAIIKNNNLNTNFIITINYSSYSNEKEITLYYEFLKDCYLCDKAKEDIEQQIRKLNTNIEKDTIFDVSFGFIEFSKKFNSTISTSNCVQEVYEQISSFIKNNSKEIKRIIDAKTMKIKTFKIECDIDINKAKQYLIENKYVEECMPLSNQQVLDKIKEILNKMGFN